MCFPAGSGVEFEVEVLEDGTVKVITGDVSGPRHMSAESFLQFLARELGGGQTRTRRAHGHTHVHAHGGVKLGGGPR